MRIAALFDIHGNLPALQGIASELSDCDAIVVGGDVVPGPMPAETLGFLEQLQAPTHFILGNTDREVLALMQGVETDWYRKASPAWRTPIEWCAKQLSASHRDWISSWPATFEIDVDSVGHVLFCHATPSSDTRIFTERTASP